MDDIIIDGNALGHAFHNTPELSYNGMVTQAIYHWTVALRGVRFAFPHARMTVLWDGQAKHRFALFEDYKGDRDRALEEDPAAQAHRAAYHKQVPVMRKVTELMGIAQVLHPDYEADDMARLLIRPGRKTMLMTGDSDWLQYLTPDVCWYDPRKGGKRIDLSNLQEHTGFFSPDEYIEGKAMQGDTSDSIPGIPKMGEKTAAEFMAKWKTVQAFFDAVDAGTYTPKTRKDPKAATKHPEEVLASPEGRELFRRNMALMDLRIPAVTSLAGLEITKGSFHPDALKVLFGRLGFVSINRNFSDWIAPFNTAAANAAA